MRAGGKLWNPNFLMVNSSFPSAQIESLSIAQGTTKVTLHMGTVSLNQISLLLKRILGGQDGTHSPLPIGDKQEQGLPWFSCPFILVSQRELFKNFHLNYIHRFYWVQMNGSNPNSNQPQCWNPTAAVILRTWQNFPSVGVLRSTRLGHVCHHVWQVVVFSQ